MKPSVARLLRPAGLVAASALLVGPALAQTPPAVEPSPGRYQFQPVEGGLARLDTATGEIAICRVDPVAMVCDLGAPSARPGPDAATPRPSAAAKAQASEDEEFERALGRMKRVFRAFGDIAREVETPPPAPPEPDRT